MLGPQLNVCADCRQMVLQVLVLNLYQIYISARLQSCSSQVIRAQGTARRLQMARSLFLPLQPHPMPSLEGGR